MGRGYFGTGGFLGCRLTLATVFAGVCLSLTLSAAAPAVPDLKTHATALSHPVIGRPPVDHFEPNIDVYPQHFAVVQDESGIAYLGTTDGILEYDGETWRLIRLPNGEMARSLAVGANNRLFVGGYNIFGYLKRDAAGTNQFVDLTKRFADQLKGREFADVWETLVTKDGVYFRALNDVFFWDPVADKVLHWQYDNKFGVIFKLGDKTLLQFRSEGLRVRVDGKGEASDWQPLPQTAVLRDLVSMWVALPDGAKIGAATDGTWWRLDAATLALTRMEMPAALKPSTEFSSGLLLADNSVAFAARDGRILVAAPGFKNVRQFQVGKGYIADITQSRDGGMLIATDLAIHRVDWPAPWTVLDSFDGLDGTIYGITHWRGKQYLLTTAGVRLRTETLTETRFVPTGWINDLITAMIGLDDRRALLAGNHYLYVVEGNVARRAVPDIIYPRMFLKSRFHPDKMFVGTEDGMRALTVRGQEIKASKNLPGLLAVRISTIVERSATELWAGSERHGVWRFTLDKDGEIVEGKRVTEADGVIPGQIAEAIVSEIPSAAGGEPRMIVSTRKGLFELQGDRFIETKLDGLVALTGEETVTLFATPKGELRAFSPTRIFSKSATGWMADNVRALRKGAFQRHLISADGDIIYLATGSILINQAAAPREERLAKVIMRRAVQVQADGTRTLLPIDGRVPLALPEGRFILQFEFALPQLSRDGSKRYQSRLVGSDEKFTDWSDSHQFSYGALSPKDYRLEVRAIDGFGRISEMQPFEFKVAEPWYMSMWARLGMAALLIVSVWSYVVVFTRYRTKKLEGQKVVLETKVVERTRELADAIRRLDMMAHVDGLTGVPNRRRLDEYLQVVWANCRDQQKPLSILVIDVDLFKQFNDQHGHLAGDRVLKEVAEHLMRCLRRTEDLLARYGGEEFTVVLPGADSDVGAAMAETMRQAIEVSSIGVTISVGVCTRVPHSGVPADLIAEADKALYVAKREGRNVVRVCEAA